MCSPQYVIELFMRGNAQRFLKNFLGDDAKSKKNLEKVSPCEEASVKEWYKAQKNYTSCSYNESSVFSPTITQYWHLFLNNSFQIVQNAALDYGRDKHIINRTFS